MLQPALSLAVLLALACAGPVGETGNTDVVNDDVEDVNDDVSEPNIARFSVECSGENDYDYRFSAEVSQAKRVWVDMWVGEDVLGTIELTDRTEDWYADAVPNELGGNRCTEVAEEAVFVLSASGNDDQVAESTADDRI